MVHKCVVRGCSSEWYPGCDVKFHLFPRNTKRRTLWLSIVPLKSQFYEGAKICSWHFKQTDYECNGKCLKQTASPFFVESCSSTSRLNIRSSTRPEPSVPTICVSKRLDGYVEIPPSTKKAPLKFDINRIRYDLPATPVPAPEDANPLFLENEPMDAIAQDSDSTDTVSIKSETISIKSDGGEGQSESDEEDKYDKQEESGENVKEIKEKDDEQNENDDELNENVEQNENDDDDDKYENYKSDDDDENYKSDDDDEDEEYKSVIDGESDITGSLSCSSSDAEFDEEMPIPIPTAAAASISPTIAKSTSLATSTTTVAPTTPIDHASPAYKQSKMLQRQNIRIEMQRKKLKCLNNQIHRKNKKLEHFKKQMWLLKEYTKCSEIENILRGNFRKLCTAVNKNGVPVNYSDEVIKFAITLNYHSPKAYEFIRKYMSLPNTRMIEKYAATGNYIINLDD